MPHCLYVGTLTDLSGFFLKKGGCGGRTFIFIVWWLFARLIIELIVYCFGCGCSPPSAFFSLFGIGSLHRALQCPILRVTSTSLRALWLFIRVRLTGPLLWLPRGMKTWRGRHLAQRSALIPDRLLSPPRLVRASPARCHTPRTRLRDSHLTW